MMIDDRTAASAPLASDPQGWGLIWRGLEVRLRFVFVFALLAGLMAIWPWLRIGWGRLFTNWSPHSSQGVVSADSEFFCPMDPGVVSAWPAICPICNMDLIPRKKADATLLPDGVVSRMQISPYRIQLAGVRIATARESESTPSSSSTSVLVPATAIVEHGKERVIYVETMPGMFDGLRVKLGVRQGDNVLVEEGLRPGQKVVAMGAFLIDAESRLNSNIATQYFGANPQPAAVPPVIPVSRSARQGLDSLSEADRQLVELQKICPVTEASLGSMGAPVSVLVGERRVFLCCRACEGPLKREPDKFLSKLPKSTTPPQRAK